MHVAAERGSERALRFLISKDVDLNAVDKTEAKSILHVAVSQGKREVVAFLVKKGVDVNSVDKVRCASVLELVICMELKRIVHAVGWEIITSRGC